MNKTSDEMGWFPKFRHRWLAWLKLHSAVFWGGLLIFSILLTILLWFWEIAWDFSRRDGSTFYPGMRLMSLSPPAYSVLQYGMLFVSYGLAVATLYTVTPNNPDQRYNTGRLGAVLICLPVFVPCLCCCYLWSLLFVPGHIVKQEAALQFENHEYKLVSYQEFAEHDDFDRRYSVGPIRPYLCKCDGLGWFCKCQPLYRLGEDGARQLYDSQNIDEARLEINHATDTLEVILDEARFTVKSCQDAPFMIQPCATMYFAPIPTP
jgi:hypothetical protein